ncbi:MAG: LysE family translocator [Burkholderiaceae bacterium]|jgi:threonine/homoserine/homoserine lactone efflux protein|nr:LysE family translocator [Burkholderiaceae bacterium]MDP5111734.1 LysE family translocator [Burkholderiaceae bacterium]
MIDWHIVMAMAMFALASSITPGPNNMMLLSSGVNYGFKRTIPHMLGISSGHLVLLLAIAAGLDQLFQLFPLGYQIMKGVGFCYLLYLAWRIAFSTTPLKRGETKGHPSGFFGAALFQWVNPKALLMAITYFSNYMPIDASITFIFLTCLMFTVINLPCLGLWVLLGTQLERVLSQPRQRQVFNLVMALLLVLSMVPVLLT